MRNPRGEWLVIVPWDSPIFLRRQDSQGNYTIPLQYLESDVVRWFRLTIGKRARYLDDTSEENPWRFRVWQINVSNAFFFRTARQAMLFKLRWT